MYISKKDLRRLLKITFRSGMTHGYGINHENIHEEEDKEWEEYLKTIDELKSKK